jgi:methylated-DNA-[protein]-cysteine S-methyltransferase
VTTHEPRQPERSDLFVALPAIDEKTARRLHDRLVREAQTAGLLDVAYRTIDSPVGPLLLAATAKGLVRVAYGCEDHEKVLERLARELSPRILHAPARLDVAAKEIDEYFAGLRQGFDLPVDFSLARGFRRLVLTRLRAIGYGQTASYAAIALAAGNPKAVRAVGTACATNPIPVVVPCHRVVRSDGSIGQYVGGVDAKKTLLTLEGRPAN